MQRDIQSAARKGMSICHPRSSAGLGSSQVMLQDLFSTHCMWQGKSRIRFLR